MFNVCPSCGQYSDAWHVGDDPVAICPNCGHRQAFVRLPLFILTGASGTGKSTLCQRLAGVLGECVVLESDILWRPEFDTQDDSYAVYRNLWLRLVKNIHQSGRPVLLCGTATPGQFETCSERRYIGEIHYLALVAEPDILARRLRDRPAWRESGSKASISAMLSFNQWHLDQATASDSPLTLLDTSQASIDESARDVIAWVRAILNA